MSRDAILKKIDAANVGRTSTNILTDAAALIGEPAIYRAEFDDVTTFDRFVQKATSETVTATVEEISSLEKLPQAVARYLTEMNLPKRIALQPRELLTSLDWADLETVGWAMPDEPAAVTFADAGIAETGSLVFQTAPDAPVLLNFLPLHHLAVIRKSSIKRYMEEIFDHFGTAAADQKRSLNVITGTSGTADIEAKNVRGAHGPRFMHIYCVDD